MKKLLLVFMAALAISCGNDTKKKDEPAKPTIGTSATQETAAVEDEDPAVAKVTIQGNDQMKFNKSEIRVKAGQTVVLTLKHVGSMSIDVMGHNWVLVAPGTDLNKLGADAVDAKDSDYIPAGYEDAIIAHTKMIGGGETVTIEFEAPEAGTYEFLCTFPGHVALMQGKFIVE